MIQKLKQCHEAEMDTATQKPYMMEDMSYAVAPLFKRGLIEVKKEVVDNKLLHCIHLTKEGIEYLENLKPVEKHAQVKQ
jgi:DNA-binding MarR family transcriptional regulator